MVGPTLGWGLIGGSIVIGGWASPLAAGPAVPITADLLGAITADLDAPPLFTLVNSQDGAAGHDPDGLTLADIPPSFWFDPGQHDAIICYWDADVFVPGDSISIEALLFDGIAGKYVSAGRALNLENKTLAAFATAGSHLVAVRVISVTGLFNDPGNNLKVYAAGFKSDPDAD